MVILLEAIIITILFIIALDQHNKAKYYKNQYQKMMCKYNDTADENHHLKVKYGLLPIFSYDVMEDDIYDI